jgi:hypothetical protein
MAYAGRRLSVRVSTSLTSSRLPDLLIHFAPPKQLEEQLGASVVFLMANGLMDGATLDTDSGIRLV